MVFSKPTNLIIHCTAAYFDQLYKNPLKTKAITSCIIATFGNFISQKISGAKRINHDSLFAFAIFGFLFGGPVPHYFYRYVQQLVKNPIILLLIERCLFTPCYQALVLYMLPVLEGNTHKNAYKQMRKLYWSILCANLKYLTILQYINIKYVPSMLRVLMINVISFFWAIYLAQQQRKYSKTNEVRK